MSTATATKATIANIGTIINSGTIQDLYVDDTFSPPATPFRIHYRKIGKLYFGFWVELLPPAGGSNIIIGGQTLAEYNISLVRLATLLGITVNTSYRNTITTTFSNNSVINYNGTYWVEWSPVTTLLSIQAILAN